MLRNRFLGGVSPLALFAPETGGAEPAPSGGAPAPVNVQTETGPLSIRGAAAAFRERADKQAAEVAKAPAEVVEGHNHTATRGPDGKFAAQQPESTSQEGDAARPQDATGETQEADPAARPPLELPRSWPKERSDYWQTLDPTVQEFLIDQDKTSSADIRKRQNDLAEQSKAITAKEQAAEQARQQYEQAAQNALRQLNATVASEFADIKTQDDVVRLATEDPFRAIQFKARQDQLAALHQEVQANEQKRAQQQDETFKTWSKEQDDKFSEQFKEFNDPEKGPKARAGVTSYLTKEVGVPEDALPKLWANPLFRDAMFQRVIYDASRFHAAQQAAKAAVQKPVPQVQRPGVVQGKGEARQADIAALTQKLDGATGNKALVAAAALRAAKRAAAH